MSEVVCVNFARPMPLFPLSEAVLLPHAVQPLHIFELRYRQMIGEALDGPGQIALAVNADSQSALSHQADDNTIGIPALRKAVCIGQIIQHEPLDDGRHNILLHGVCRAEIVEVIEPHGERLYRMGMLRPIERLDGDPPSMGEVRAKLYDLLQRERMQRIRCVETLIDWFDRDELSTHALLELIGFAIVRDARTRYALLTESNPFRRAKLVCSEINAIDQMLWRADRQSQQHWPKGVSWN